MLSILLLATLMGICSAQEPPVCDSTLTSFHAVSTNCTQYYTCFNGVPTLQTCPDEKYFDAARSLCDIPANVPCTVGPCTGTTSIVALPIENVCTKYNLCLDGVVFEIECEEGTLFDETYGDCVMAKNSLCFENPCLAVDPANVSPATFYPVLNSCKNYIVCDKLNPVVRTCVGANVFSPTEAKCVLPASYTCPPGTV